MTEKTKLNENGQITIPPNILSKLNFKKNDILICQISKKGNLVIKNRKPRKTSVKAPAKSMCSIRKENYKKYELMNKIH